MHEFCEPCATEHFVSFADMEVLELMEKKENG